MSSFAVELFLLLQFLFISFVFHLRPNLKKKAPKQISFNLCKTNMSDPLYIFNKSMSLYLYICLCFRFFSCLCLIFCRYFFDYVLIVSESQSEIVVESLLSSGNLRPSMPTQQLQSLRSVIYPQKQSCSVFIF